MSNHGSEWERWDLHVHTKGTAKNDQFGDITFNDYCNELFRRALQKKIKVIGITDYFSLDNFEKVLEFQKNISNSSFNFPEQEDIKKICLIPNLELRISPTTGKNTQINIHLLFNPALLDDFKNEVLTEIKISIDGSESYNITKQGLIKLGKKFDDKALDDETAYRVGIRQAVVEHGEIIRALHKHKVFTDECLVFVANGSNDGVSGVNAHEGEQGVLTTAIYNLADGIFSAKPSDINYFSNHKQNPNNLKPCIHGCDAHNLEKLFEPALQRYCWIKAEPTFEGFKQIVHELDRVKIQPYKPEVKNVYEVIDRIEIANENFGNKTIYFNPNLNTIIGGRSSGKSTLLKCIAKKLNEDAFNNDKSNDDKTKKYIEELSKDIKIIWKDNTENDTRQIEYFYQGHMFDKSSNEGVEKIIHDILMQNNPIVFEDYDKVIADLQNQNASMLATYFSNKKSINEKNQEITILGNENDIKEQMKNYDIQIFALNLNEVSQDEMQEHELEKQKLQKSIQLDNLLSNTIVQVERLMLDDVLSFQNNLASDPFSDYFLGLYQTMIENIKVQATNELLYFKQQAILKLNEDVRNYYLNEIETINNKHRFKEIEKIYTDSEIARELFLKKEEEWNKFKRIEILKNEIDALSQQNSDLLKNINSNWEQMNQKILQVLSESNIDIDDNISFKHDLILKESEFKNFIDKNIKLMGDRALSFYERKICGIRELFSLFTEILSAINDDSIKLKAGASIEDIVREFYLTVWFKPNYDIIYEGDSYQNMSQGKKAFVVLKLTLECSNRKCPILIDQPEDDLDNRAIFSELVSYLKDKKTKRQIILATHNANVVVNADSELIIVANQHGETTSNHDEKKFEYKFGSIESMLKDDKSSTILSSKTIREHTCEILEGGDRAFKLREKRYRLL